MIARAIFWGDKLMHTTQVHKTYLQKSFGEAIITISKTLTKNRNRLKRHGDFSKHRCQMCIWGFKKTPSVKSLA